MAAPATSARLYRFLRDELQPYEGRLGLSLRMALACMLVVVLAMSQQVPEAALSCYLIFFASRDNAGSGILIGLALIAGVSVGILLGLVFLQLAADEPMLRLGLLAVFTFGGMYFSQASRAGPIAATVGFVFAFVMTLFDIVPIPELLSRALSWMWVVVFFPMAILVLINATIGRNPARLLRRGLGQRLSAVADLLEGRPGAAAASRVLLEAGVASLETYLRMGKLLGLLRKDRLPRLGALIPASQHVLLLTTTQDDTQTLRRFAPALRQLAQAVEQDTPLGPIALPQADTAAERGYVVALNAVLAAARPSGPLPQPPVPSAKAGLLMPDAFSNPVYTRFALKALLAVLITYFIYTAWDWFEIHTAMITCFYVALGSAGETLHKSALRIAGCLIGAVMGIGSIVFLMPHMTDIGQLLLLVGVGSFIAAWVSNGSSRIQYMGWQMALAFFLCVLPGFGPSFDLGVASNRVIGILIGNVVVAFIFSSIWPVSVGGAVAAALARAMAPLQAIAAQRPADLDSVPPALAEARRLSTLSELEIARLRTRSPVLPHTAVLIDGIERSAGQFARLQAMRQGPRFLAGAPRCVKAAIFAFEASLLGFLDTASSAIVTPTPEVRRVLAERLAASQQALARLVRQTGRIGPLRTGWKRDLDEAMTVYRAMERDFARTLGAIA